MTQLVLSQSYFLRQKFTSLQLDSTKTVCLPDTGTSPVAHPCPVKHRSTRRTLKTRLIPFGQQGSSTRATALGYGCQRVIQDVRCMAAVCRACSEFSCQVLAPEAALHTHHAGSSCLSIRHGPACSLPVLQGLLQSHHFALVIHPTDFSGSSTLHFREL